MTIGIDVEFSKSLLNALSSFRRLKARMALSQRMHGWSLRYGLQPCFFVTGTLLANVYNLICEFEGTQIRVIPEFALFHCNSIVIVKYDRSTQEQRKYC